jgi:hypothetical protein
MKKILLVSASLMLAAAAFSQGTIVFDNQATGVKALVYGQDPANPTSPKTGQTSGGTPAGNVTYGGALLAGTGFSATLWALNAANVVGLDDPTLSAGGNNLVQVSGVVAFRAAGLFSGRVAASAANPIVPNTPDSSTRGTFQLRAWDNKGGTITTWDQALVAFKNGTTTLGYSPLFTVQQSLGGYGTPPSTPPSLLGLQSFQLYAVPEPSTIALGVLGAGCLFLLRRRK